MRYGILLLSLALGCTGDPIVEPILPEPDPEPVNEPLNEEESLSLLTGLRYLLHAPLVVIEGDDATRVVVCPDGGELRWAITDELSADWSSFTVWIALGFTDCKFTMDDRAVTLVKGDVRDELIIGLTDSALTITGGMDGEFSWRLAERFGDCEIAMKLQEDVDLSGSTVGGTYRGPMCGLELELYDPDIIDLL